MKALSLKQPFAELILQGRKSIEFVFWLVARELLKKSGQISTNDDYKLTQQDFE